jgi:hypothetical protein
MRVSVSSLVGTDLKGQGSMVWFLVYLLLLMPVYHLGSVPDDMFSNVLASVPVHTQFKGDNL